MMSEESNLDMLREEIKKITVEIIRLTGKRLLLAKKIGEIKNQRNLPIEDLKVERELKQVIIEKCQIYNVERSFGLKLLNLLMDEAKRVQIETLNIKEKTRQSES
jgi:chorismate mutase